jgi:hypothetical protein
MAEANASLQQIPTIRITTAAHALAQLRARNAVKEEIRKQGLTLTQYSASEITSWAILYLDDLRSELMPEAIASARAMILRGDLGKRRSVHYTRWRAILRWRLIGLRSSGRIKQGAEFLRGGVRWRSERTMRDSRSCRPCS